MVTQVETCLKNAEKTVTLWTFHVHYIGHQTPKQLTKFLALRRMATYSGGNLVKIIFYLFWKRIDYRKIKNLLPQGANSFFIELTPFQMGMGMQYCKQEVTKIISVDFSGGKSTKCIQSP